MKKKYLLTIEVDVKALEQTYRKGLGLDKDTDIPPIDQLVINEMSWVVISGIQATEIKEIQYETQ